jgi:multiple sugar transport system permease protein
MTAVSEFSESTQAASSRWELSDRWLALLMILPAGVLVGAFAIYPVIQGLIESFFRIDSATLTMTYTGLSNYRQVLSDPLFWSSLGRNLIWVFVGMVAQLVLGMAISLLLHQELVGRNLARGLVLFPYLVPAIVVALTWRFVLDPTLGVFNRMLMDFGLIERPLAILANPRTALMFVIVASIWKYTPFMIIMFLARLQVIPVEQEEAARLDGASSWQVFRHITLPWMMPVVIIAMLLRTIWSFNEFEMVYLFAFGGPLFATTTLPVLVRYLAFDARQIGAAAATASLMVLMLLFMAWGYFSLYSRAEQELG